MKFMQQNQTGDSGGNLPSAVRKNLKKAERIAEKVVDTVKETPKETESHIHAKDETAVQAERPPQPKPSVLASKYPCLKEIDSRLKDQNKAVLSVRKSVVS